MIRCSKCPRKLPHAYSAMCAECHQKEVERIHRHDTAELVYECDVPYQPPEHRIVRGQSRRVNRKPGIVGG